MENALIIAGMRQASAFLKKLVWAVDAFEEPTGPWRHAADVIRQLQKSGSWSVQPVHILSPAELNLSAEFAGPWVAQYLPSAREAIDRLLGGLDLQNLMKSEIITQPAASTIKAVDTLVEHAEHAGAELIVAGTHGRHGLGRWLLGSFAETLLLRSRVPVLAAGAQARCESGFKKVLFPTDFAEQSHHVFRQAVGFARDLGARLTLYHAIPRPIEPVFQSGIYMIGTPWIPVQEYYQRMAERHRQHVGAWVDWANNQGVQTEAVIDTESLDVADAILKVARDREIGLIAMAAQNGPIAAAFLGSVVRQVVRAAHCPVWVVRPEALDQRRRSQDSSAA
jgi:nucleotide-binding universal stress UspA family protein